MAEATTARIPAPTTPLIGRERELSLAKDLLWNPDVRLVSLLGLGGIGKTRLAIEISSELRSGPGFVDGIHFVDLAPILDPRLVPSTISRAIGLPDAGVGVDVATLGEGLHDSDMLVVLDNFERLLPAAADVASLLAASPRLSVLVTSRRPLHVHGEHQIIIPPLDLPDAVALFSARALAVRTGFRLDETSTPVVESICTKLDGLPLAIELAAARSNVLTPEALRTRLGHSLTMLAGGPTDQPERLRSVQAMVAWSVDLLTPPVRRCLLELSVLSGGWSLEGAEAVCTDRAGVVDALGALIEHHLVQRDDSAGESRFVMFETVREYSHQRLVEDGEADVVNARHAAFCLALAHEAERGVAGAEQAAWLDRVELEHDNIRFALAWTLEHDPGAALQIAGLMGRSWLLRGYASEGLDWLERSLAAAPSAPTEHRALALLGAGWMLEAAASDAAAESRYRESLEAYTDIGDQRGMANACRNLGNACIGGARYEQAASWYQRSQALGEELGDGFVTAGAVFSLGNVAYFQGDYDTAEELWRESAIYFRAIGDTSRMTSILNNLAELTALRGDHAMSVRLHEENIELRRSVGDRIGLAQTMVNYGRCLAATGELAAARVVLTEVIEECRRLGIERDAAAGLYHLALVARAEGHTEEAMAFAAECLVKKSMLGEQFDVATALELIAALAADLGQPTLGAQILGATSALRREIGARPFPDDNDAAMILETVRDALGAEPFAAAHAEGEKWALDEARAAARSVAERVGSSVSRSDTETERHPVAERLGLTSRELEVLGYLAQRYTDREIASALVISLRPVTTHVGRILMKLGVDGRRQAAVEATRLGLIAS